MDKDALSAWALGHGWQMLEGHPSLTRAGRPKEPVVRMVLKATVATIEAKKPAGSKWEKIAGAAYKDVTPDPETGVPRGLGLVSTVGMARLMEENADRVMMARIGAG